MLKSTISSPRCLRVLLHAPSASAVRRARNNALNLLRATSDAEVRIIVNADGVAALLDDPHPQADAITLVCENTLERTGRQVTAPLLTVPVSVLAIAQMQQDGWIYIRA